MKFTNFLFFNRKNSLKMIILFIERTKIIWIKFDCNGETFYVTLVCLKIRLQSEKDHN